MNARTQKLLAWMEDNALDVVLLTSPKHVYYLTGFLTDPHERFLGLLLPRGGEPVLIVPALEAAAAEAASAVRNIKALSDTENPFDLLKQLLPTKVNRFGLEKGQVTVKRFEELQAAIGASRYMDVEHVLYEMRLVKTPDEISRIRQAVHIVEQVLREGVKKVAVGVTEREVAAELDYLMKKRGADGASFATTVLAGANSALPHGQPGSRKIQAGDFLLCDLGVYVDGYVSDITRTFAVGEIDARQRDIYETVLSANLAAIDAVKPGVPLAELDRAARRVIDEKGYGVYFIHRLGHGIGMDVHEPPSVHANNQEPLRPGMVFTIEPGVYVPGLGGVRIEDDVLVTAQGVEVLTGFPKQLTVLG